jgi:hypothetical protein
MHTAHNHTHLQQRLEVAAGAQLRHDVGMVVILAAPTQEQQQHTACQRAAARW